MPATVTRPLANPVGLPSTDSALIDTARLLTADEGLSHDVTYRIGDAPPAYDDSEFDIVTLHTLVSHVDDPATALSEARRVVRPGGTVAVFDATTPRSRSVNPDHTLAAAVEEKLRQLIVANPRVMRDMPALLRMAGLELVEADGVLYPNIGTSRFWLGAAESYGALLGRSDVLPPAVIDGRRAHQARSAEDNTFFAACGYSTYLARRPRGEGVPTLSQPARPTVDGP